MRYEVKKLFMGYVSVRDYIVDHLADHGGNLEIVYEGKIMTVPNKVLQERPQIHKTTFTSKFNGKSYMLYDFKFKADEQQKAKQLTLI